jgi:oligoendopeptidase F
MIRAFDANILPAKAAHAASESAAKTAKALGTLPEWDLSHLYPAMDSPIFAADLDKAFSEAQGFAALYRGKLAALVDRPDAAVQLAEAIKAYEKLSDLLGRIGAYAGLVYSGDTTDPKRAKFYGDTQDRLNAAVTELLFFELELNRIDPAVMAGASAQAPLSHWKPWLDDLAKDKPYQLEDRIEQLFPREVDDRAAAWNRLFDETMTSLRFDIDGEELTLELTLNKLQDADGEVRRGCGGAGLTFRKQLRTFTLITNTLAKDKEISDRWRGFEDIADSRHLANRVERDVVDALVTAVREAYPRLSHRYYDEGRWLGMEQMISGTATRRCRRSSSASSPGPRPRHRADAYQCASRPRWPASPGASSTRLDRRAGPARQGARRLRAPDRALGASLCAGQLQGKPRDVMTLAHELGHGVHQVLAGPKGALMARRH